MTDINETEDVNTDDAKAPVVPPKAKNVEAKANAKKSDYVPKKAIVVNGVNLLVDPDVMDDEETFDKLDKLYNGNPFGMPKILKDIVGDEQYAKIQASVRTKDGRVPASKLSDICKEVVEKLAPKG